MDELWTRSISGRPRAATMLSRRQWLAVLAAGFGTAAGQRVFARTTSTPDQGLVFRDLERFEAAYAQVKNGRSAGEAMSLYFDGATSGLKAYSRTYGVTSADVAERFTTHPQLYAQLANILAGVTTYQAEILRAASELRILAPKLPDVPIYIFVGAMGHGATVKEVTPQGGEHGLGVLLPIELVVQSQAEVIESYQPEQGRAPLDNLVQFTTHELVHVAQVQYQGLARYRTLYAQANRGTHLGYAIREGGADFVCYLVTGSLRRRHRYVLQHEAELWREFSSLLSRPVAAHPGWFSGRHEHDALRPSQLGYAIGWLMCRRYHENAQDKAAAVLEILSANDAADFEKIAGPYRQLLNRP